MNQQRNNAVYIIEDDTRDIPRRAACTVALTLGLPSYWGKSIPSLNRMIQKHGMPKVLILDNNLGLGDDGIEWIDDQIKEGNLPPDMIVSALSSSNVSLVLRIYKRLNDQGIGAFPKPHIAELCLWAAMRIDGSQKNNPIVSQDTLYNVAKSDTSFLTAFGRVVDSQVRSVPELKALHPINARGLWPEENDNETCVLPWEGKRGLFPYLLERGIPGEQVITMNKEDMQVALRELYPGGEGHPPGKERG